MGMPWRKGPSSGLDPADYAAVGLSGAHWGGAFREERPALVPLVVEVDMTGLGGERERERERG